MTYLRSLLTIMLFAAVSCFFVACSGGEANTAKTVKNAPPKIEKAVDKNGKEYTSRYICPMRCKGSGTETKGQKCPACKMDLVENKKHAHYGHNH